MPIPALARTAPQPPLPRGPLRRTLVLTGGNGDSIDLTAEPWRVRKTVGLFESPLRTLAMVEGGEDGSTYGGSRLAGRVIELDVRVQTRLEEEMQHQLDRLDDILDDTYGPALLTVTAQWAGKDKARQLLVYSEGWRGAQGHQRWQAFPLTLLAEEAVFSATQPEWRPFRVPGVPKPFLGSGQFFPVQVSSSQVLGELEVLNPGNARTPVLWRLTGPSGTVTAARGSEVWTIPDGIPDGTTWFLDTSLGTLVEYDEDGEVDHYDKLGDAPDFWRLPPGRSTVTVSMEDATSPAQAELIFQPRFKRAG